MTDIVKSILNFFGKYNKDEMEFPEMSMAIERGAENEYINFEDDTHEYLTNIAAGDHVISLKLKFADDIAKLLKPYNIEITRNFHDTRTGMNNNNDYSNSENNVRGNTTVLKSVSLTYLFKVAHPETGYESIRELKIGTIYVTDMASTPLKKYVNARGYTLVGPEELNVPESQQYLNMYIVRFVPKYKREHELKNMRAEDFKQVKAGIRAALKGISNKNEEELSKLEKKIAVIEAKGIPPDVARIVIAGMLASPERLQQRTSFLNYHTDRKMPRLGNLKNTLNKRIATPGALKKYQESRRKRKAELAERRRKFNRIMNGKSTGLLERMGIRFPRGGTRKLRRS